MNQEAPCTHACVVRVRGADLSHSKGKLSQMPVKSSTNHDDQTRLIATYKKNACEFIEGASRAAWPSQSRVVF